jgi:hypothetical protein
MTGTRPVMVSQRPCEQVRRRVDITQRAQHGDTAPCKFASVSANACSGGPPHSETAAPAAVDDSATNQ